MGTFMQELERIQIRTATAMAIEAEHKAERARLEVEKARVELRSSRQSSVPSGKSKKEKK